MTSENGGEDRLAPVIPLFGGGRPDLSDFWRGAESGGGAPDDASQPLDDASQPPDDASQPHAGWHRSWIDDQPPVPASDDAEGDLVADAEKALLRKLRGRSLSVREARSLAREQGLSPEAAEALIAAFVARGYLDDARLAEQLIHVGIDRKSQGRQAIGMALAKRGVPRDVADAALEGLPDDDAERALEFARSKARSLAKLDREVALRRLLGQLARRGFGGASARDAAHTALTEATAPARRVRFE